MFDGMRWKSIHQLNVMVIDRLINLDHKVPADGMRFEDCEPVYREELAELYAELRRRALVDAWKDPRVDWTSSADKPGLHNLLDANGVVHSRIRNHPSVPDNTQCHCHSDDEALMDVNLPVDCSGCLDWRDFDHETALEMVEDRAAGVA